ncbi:MAG: hydroxymethylbilane synthase [Deltaproteobacteria bacterium]|nr:hydroxymethylbilane synthase [Deltaproteobacteria bacterium]
MILRIGTRGSRLALRQSRWVKEKLEVRHPDLRVELIRIKTTGDKILDAPLSRIGGKGLFVKEIEDALLTGSVDVAVHSMKDVPAQLPDRLTLATFPERELPYDAFISEISTGLDTLPAGAQVGTSSLRRGSQLLHLRPDLELVAMRGNVDTRIGKLTSGEVQAIILAAAGLKRMGLESRISRTLSPDEMLPAIGQGALGLEVRRDDDETMERLHFLDHPITRIQVTAERALLKRLEGGCQVPIAGLAKIEKDEVVLEGMVAELDGSTMVRETLKGAKDQAAEIGAALAERLLSRGADKILARIYQNH